GGNQSAARQFLIVQWAGPQVCVELRTSDCRGRIIDGGTLPIGGPLCPTGGVATAVWNGHCHGRSVFRACRPDYGSLLDGTWCGGVVRPGALGKPIHGRGFRSRADRLRFVDCFAARWLSEFWKTGELWRDHRQSGRRACKKRRPPPWSPAQNARPCRRIWTG